MEPNNTQKLYTLTEACELLSISTATGRNWIKSGRLVSAALPGKQPVFEPSVLLSLKEALSSGTVSGLKGRRNKAYVKGMQTYGSYISKESENHAALKQLQTVLEQETIVIDETLLLCLLRHCAQQLISKAGYENTLLFDSLLDDLASAKAFSTFEKNYGSLCEISYSYDSREDTLGFLYMSLCNLRDRKASGSYYTPVWLAKRLVEQHLTELDTSKTILDPSCGTGIFLLQLPKTLPLKNLYGNDSNPVCVTLARINLALKYKVATPEDIKTLKTNLTVSDFLCTDDAKGKGPSNMPQPDTYDIILGNPPWGARLSSAEKKLYRTHFSCASGTSVEIYDLFIEQSLHHLASKGTLSFVLPEALLTVKSHTPVRELLLQKTSVLSVEYLGEAFEQVHCPSIIFTVTANSDRAFFKNVNIHTREGMYSTKVERIFSADYFHFLQTDEEYLLLQKILACPNHTTLVDNADFALGIVTGNNSALLYSAPAPGLEPIIKGTDISKYHINSCSGYLKFTPEHFQQTAPEHFYRAPEKLFYRFINKQLIFAYDDTGLLSLNSCNILIPHIDGLSIKYILAILNSSIAQFVFEKKFHSVKVLRSHLEQLPIPLANEQTQEEIVELVDSLMESKETSGEYNKTFARLDRKVAELFGLTTEEFEIIAS